MEEVDDSTPVRGVPYEPPALYWVSAELRLSQIIINFELSFPPHPRRNASDNPYNDNGDDNDFGQEEGYWGTKRYNGS